MMMQVDNGSGSSTEDTEEDKKLLSRGRQFRYGFHLVKGKKDHGMKDYIVAEKRQVNGN